MVILNTRQRNGGRVRVLGTLEVIKIIETQKYDDILKRKLEKRKTSLGGALGRLFEKVSVKYLKEKKGIVLEHRNTKRHKELPISFESDGFYKGKLIEIKCPFKNPALKIREQTRNQIRVGLEVFDLREGSVFMFKFRICSMRQYLYNQSYQKSLYSERGCSNIPLTIGYMWKYSEKNKLEDLSYCNKKKVFYNYRPTRIVFDKKLPRKGIVLPFKLFKVKTENIQKSNYLQPHSDLIWEAFRAFRSLSQKNESLPYSGKICETQCDVLPIEHDVIQLGEL